MRLDLKSGTLRAKLETRNLKPKTLHLNCPYDSDDQRGGGLLHGVVHRVSSNLLELVHPSFRALFGRPKFTVRHHKSKSDFLYSQGVDDQQRGALGLSCTGRWTFARDVSIKAAHPPTGCSNPHASQFLHLTPYWRTPNTHVPDVRQVLRDCAPQRRGVHSISGQALDRNP